MKNRGRPSANALSIVPTTLEVIDRPAPPHGFGDEHAAHWNAIVNGHPPDWFEAGALPVLAQLCRHIVIGNRLAEMIEWTEEADEMLPLLKEQRAESDIVRRLATSLRITPQALTNHRGNKKSSSTNKPWALQP